jgi:hypothetical protein
VAVVSKSHERSRGSSRQRRSTAGLVLAALLAGASTVFGQSQEAPRNEEPPSNPLVELGEISLRIDSVQSSLGAEVEVGRLRARLERVEQ